ncbi:acyl carrier protein [Kitasatospora cineracea]|uniref:Acyl carrier protein n=1 Tax=Kitasatospora cineracea TaxID=88074 RepID=A0A3N4R691_9ACTN|nr:phosphopantetheine-binding protein [Kitasatospora cineracea]RPE26899.1 acyl carrier protein [Kitasatospora cineracea]
MREWSLDEIGTTIRTMLTEDLYLPLDPAAIRPDADLVDDLGLGSLDLSELRGLCENRFGVPIAETDFNPVHFHSVDTLSALLAHSLGRRPAPTA